MKELLRDNELFCCNIIDHISRLKKRGMNTNEIMDNLAVYYSFREILEYLIDNKYIVKSIITEKLVVIDTLNNNTEKDGLLVLHELIESIS